MKLAARFKGRLKTWLRAEHPELFQAVPPKVWWGEWVADIQPVGSGAAAHAKRERIAALLDWNEPPPPPPRPACAKTCPTCGQPMVRVATLLRLPFKPP